mmetsp:Transcript_59642/g.182147  ORF Transcript_59642/g.182147 Transcript_59642/m.182147 type:complete len:557 (-) Transcript_59642:462-2132(-)
MFSTAKTSSPCCFISCSKNLVGSRSSFALETSLTAPSALPSLASLASLATLASAASLASRAWYALCAVCHTAMSLTQQLCFFLNQSEGCKSSMGIAFFRSRTQLLKCSVAFSFGYHWYRISSKPSSLSGKLNLAIAEVSAGIAMSGIPPGALRNHICFSSSLNTARGAGPRSSSSIGATLSSSSFGGSSSLGSSTFSPFAIFAARSFALIVASNLRLRSLAILCCVFFIASTCLARSALLRFWLCSASSLSCLPLRTSCWVRRLKSSPGSPIMTTATFLKAGATKFLRAASLSAFKRLPRTSMTRKSRGISGANRMTALSAALSSSAGRPKPMPGLSLETSSFESALFLTRLLLSAQSTMALSLSSLHRGFFSRNSSAQSKAPWSGRKTGNSTSQPPGFGEDGCCSTATSAAAASSSSRHWNGRGRWGAGPKFTCTDTHLNITVGYRAWPNNGSGSRWGSVSRAPSTNNEMVPAFGPPFSKFMTTATTAPFHGLPFWTIFVFFLLYHKKPSESKHMLSSASPTSGEEPRSENPIRKMGFAAGCPSDNSSTPLTSNI